MQVEVSRWVSRPASWRFRRETPTRRPVAERVHDYLEVYNPFPIVKLREQGARCMDCGIPFCHQGCPLGNLIPDWNDLVYRDQWRAAIDRLHATNNFPEFTGTLCPAPCEASCVLGINDDPVTIKQIEASIIDRAWDEGWVVPEPPKVRTGKTVAVVGSGPAGLAAAQQLARAGHDVTVFERADRIGGLLRYGIPDFKMEKRRLDRRLEQMEAEGVDLPARRQRRRRPAGRPPPGRVRRRLPLRRRDPAPRPADPRPRPGRHPLRDGLPAAPEQAGRRRRDRRRPSSSRPKGKHVIIIGGGDTGADCLGTVHRQGCASVHQFEIVPRPPDDRASRTTPGRSGRTSSASPPPTRRGASASTRSTPGGSSARTAASTALETVRVEMKTENGRAQFVEIPGTETIYPADLVLLAMGFVGPERKGMLEQLGVELDRDGQRQGRRGQADERRRRSSPPAT